MSQPTYLARTAERDETGAKHPSTLQSRRLRACVI